MVFHNELQYRHVNVHINSSDDIAISGKNLVNFGPVTPEIMRVVFEIFVTTWPKVGKN